MDPNKRIGTGIEGLDRAIDGLRSGDTVLWQIAHIRDYIFAATQFVASTARDGQRIVYLRFGDHDEVIDAQALAERGANVKKYVLDPTVGFETFAVQVHRIVAAEGEGDLYTLLDPVDLEFYAAIPEQPDLPDATRAIPNPDGKFRFMKKMVEDQVIADSLNAILRSY